MSLSKFTHAFAGDHNRQSAFGIQQSKIGNRQLALTNLRVAFFSATVGKTQQSQWLLALMLNFPGGMVIALDRVKTTLKTISKGPGID